MSEQAVETAPCSHNRPPPYNSSQPSQDLLASVTENIQTIRKLFQRIDEIDTEIVDLTKKLKKCCSTGTPDWNRVVEYFEQMCQKSTEMAQICTRFAELAKECALHNNNDLYKALSDLEETELQRTYDALKRHPTWQMRHELAHNHEHSDKCKDGDYVADSQTSSTIEQVKRASECLSDSSCSYDQLVELSAKMDKLNESLWQSLPSHGTVNMSTRSVNTTVKPAVGFWKRVFKRSA